MERESFEDPEIAALMNEHFVPIKVDREERPDIDALYMEAVPGDDRARRLAADRVPDSRAASVLRRDVLPARAASRDAELAEWCCSPSPRPGAPGARRSEHGERRIRALGATARIEPSAEPIQSECSLDGRSRPARELRRRARRLGRGAEVPPRRNDRVAARPRRARDVAGTLDAMARGGHLRPGRRRVRTLRGRCTLDGAALREDALRQRAAGARLPARLAGLGEERFAARLLRDARLGAAGACAGRRAASARRWTRTPRARREASTSGGLTSFGEVIGPSGSPTPADEYPWLRERAGGTSSVGPPRARGARRRAR